MYRAIVEGKRYFLFDGNVKDFTVDKLGVELQDLSTEGWTKYYWQDIRQVRVSCDDYTWVFKGERGI